MKYFKSKFIFLLCLWWWGWGLILFLSSSGNFGENKIVFCPVGQGDATILLTKGAVMLVDGGPDESVLSCLRQHVPWRRRRIDFLVLTHADSDHYSGLKSVLRQYQVDNLLLPLQGDANGNFAEFYQLVWQKRRQENLSIWLPVHAQKWCLGQNLCCQIISQHHFYSPENIWQDEYHYKKLFSLITENNQYTVNKNNGSIVLNCNLIDKKIILTGDIETDAELSLLGDDLLTKVDILKVAHHGSKSSSSWNFLQKVKPEHSTIMCGQNNRYGHPHQIVLARLHAVGSHVWRTDINGQVVFSYQPRSGWHVTSQY